MSIYNGLRYEYSDGIYHSNYNKGSQSYSNFVKYVQNICKEYKTSPYILFWVISSVYRPFDSLKESVNYPDSKNGYVQCDFIIYDLETFTRQRFYECRSKHRCLIFNDQFEQV